jgi:hypothetical protein
MDTYGGGTRSALSLRLRSRTQTRTNRTTPPTTPPAIAPIVLPLILFFAIAEEDPAAVIDALEEAEEDERG